MLTKTNFTPLTSGTDAAHHGAGAATTAPFSPAANCVLVVRASALESTDAGLAGSSLTISDSVDGGTGWVSQVASSGEVGWSYGTRVWTKAIGGNATPYASMTVSCDAGASSILNWRVEPYQYTTDGPRNTIFVAGTASGVDADGNNAATITLTSAPKPNSFLQGFVITVSSTTGTLAVTHGAGYVEDYDAGGAGSEWYCNQSQYTTGTRNPGIPWDDLHTGTTSPVEALMVGIEIAETVFQSPSVRQRRRTRYGF